jgi:hypothetical protein
MLDHDADTLPYHSPLAQDPVLKEVVWLFVEEMPCRLARMREYFQDCQWHALRMATRHLTTSASSHGFDQLVPFTTELEGKLSRRAPTAQVEEALDTLLTQCGRVTATP